MSFVSYIPSDILKPYIQSFVATTSEEENTYKVLPGTHIVLGFQFKGRLSLIRNNTDQPLSSSGISGLDNQYRVFKNSAGTGTILAYFKEAGAVPFFKQPLHELFRESISLDNFFLRSELLVTEEKLCNANTDKERIQAIESFLINRMIAHEPDRLVLMALGLIHKSKGDIKIRDLALQLHTSQSPLEKRFRQQVGTTPKKFASIVRMKHLIQNFRPGNSLTQLGYESGFYDQSHFIKEFRAFTGQSPESFFKSQ
jgi:AraC-like DNA-binding protein